MKRFSPASSLNNLKVFIAVLISFAILTMPLASITEANTNRSVKVQPTKLEAQNVSHAPPSEENLFVKKSEALFAPLAAPPTSPVRTLYSSIPQVNSAPFNGAVGAFPINLSDGSLASPGTLTGSNGSNTVPIALSSNGAYLYAANIGSDTVDVFTVNSNGSLTYKSSSAQIVGMASAATIAVAPSGSHVYVIGNNGQHNPGSTTQTAVAALKVSAVDGSLTIDGSLVTTGTNHAYNNPDFFGVAVTPDGGHLYVATALADQISHIALNADGSLGTLTNINVTAGDGPLALAINPNNNALYVVNDGNNVTGTTISAYPLTNGDIGATPTPQKVNSGGSNPAVIAVAPDAAHLWVTNEGISNSNPQKASEFAATQNIATFTLNADGTLAAGSPTTATDTDGLVPQSIAASPDGKHVYVGNFYGSTTAFTTPGNVVDYSVGANGVLTRVGVGATNTDPELYAIAINPNQPPIASFTVGASPTATQPITFDGSASSDPDGTVARYDWNFGDGTLLPNGGPTPSHTYAHSGMYTVTLTLTDNEGCSSSFIYTGQTASCNGGGSAVAEQIITVAKANQTITVTTHAPANAPFNSMFTVAATASSGLPVTYSSSGSCTNSGATFTITSPTGTCTVMYNQAGDTNTYNAAPQVTESVTAQKANQTITVNTHAPATATYNSSFTVAATSSSGLPVTYSSSGSCTNVGATFTITSGTGTCTVKYDQAGNANFNAAPQVTETVNSQKANQTITVNTHAPTTAAYNSSFTVAATSNSNLPVTYSSSGSCTNVGATFTITSGTGTCTVKYDQAGDTNYNAATQVTETVTAQTASQTITVTTHAPASAAFNSNFTVAATSSSGLPVTYSSSGSCTNVGATFTMTSGTGTCTVMYNQAGNGNYSAAPQVTETVNAQKASQTITVTTHAPASAPVNSSFTVAATSSSGLPVAYSSSGSCTNSGATFTMTSGTGICTVKYDQTGNGNFSAAPQVTETVTAQKANQTITVNTHAPTTAAYNSSFTVAATSNSNLPVTYSSSGSCTNVGATFTITSGTGTCTVKYDQAGDTNYNAASQVTETVNAQQVASNTTVTSSVNPSNLGQSVTFTATVTSTTGTPTGTVQFKDGANTIGVAVNCVAGGANTCTAQVSTSSLTSGAHTITAQYSGDANIAGSTGTLTGGQAVNIATTISINDVSAAEGNSGTTAFNFTVTLSQASNLTVKVDFATVSGTATAGSDYQATSGTLTFNPGDLTKTITVLVNGDTVNEPDETFFVNLTNPQNAMIARAQATGTILNDDAPGIQFSAATYSVNENGVDAVVTVNRVGDLSGPATVDFATSDTSGLTPCSTANGMASQRCDYETTIGTLKFAAGESSKSIFIPIIDDAYVEGPETFTITLSNATGGSLGSNSTATITINDNDTVTGANPIDRADFFVRQHYLDFLDREPEPKGFTDWQNILNNCGTTVQQPCDRIEVSSDFFRSEEFQQRGYFIYRFYTTLGRFPHYAEFVPDMAKVSGFLSSMDLESMKMAFVQEFMNRQEFQNKYGSLTDPTAYVDALLQTVGLPNHSMRGTWIAGLTNGTLTRGQVLRALIESTELYNKFYNAAFVIEAYFGYLKRDPDSLYLQWLQMLNQTGDYRTLVNGFVNSLEYRQRFGP